MNGSDRLTTPYSALCSAIADSTMVVLLSSIGVTPFCTLIFLLRLPQYKICPFVPVLASPMQKKLTTPPVPAVIAPKLLTLFHVVALNVMFAAWLVASLLRFQFAAVLAAVIRA